jgi:hypothetical protein
MIDYPAMTGLMAALLLFAGPALAEDKEPFAIVQIGAAGEWSLQDGGSGFGPSVAVETTVIRNWLEIEAGVAPLFGGGQTQWSTDLLFKKPWTLSKTVEFEVGVAPAWLHTTGGGKTTDSLGGEVVAEFLFWPWPDRKLGWYLEPSYGYDFGGRHDQSLGVNVGLLIPIP